MDFDNVRLDIRTCCFCWDFSQGTLAVAFVYWISSLVVLGISAEQLNKASKAYTASSERNAKMALYSMSLILSFVLLVSAMILFTSVTRRARNRLIPWMAVVPLWFVCVAVTFLAFEAPNEIVGPFIGVGILFLITAYSYFCVVMYFKDLLREKGQPKNTAPLTSLISGNFDAAGTTIRHSFRSSKKMVRRLSMRKPKNWASGEPGESTAGPRRERTVPMRGPLTSNNHSTTVLLEETNGQPRGGRGYPEKSTSPYQASGPPPRGSEGAPKTNPPPTYNDVYYDGRREQISCDRKIGDERFPILGNPPGPDGRAAHGQSNAGYEPSPPANRRMPTQRDYDNRNVTSEEAPRYDRRSPPAIQYPRDEESPHYGGREPGYRSHNQQYTEQSRPDRVEHGERGPSSRYDKSDNTTSGQYQEPGAGRMSYDSYNNPTNQRHPYTSPESYVPPSKSPYEAHKNTHQSHPGRQALGGQHRHTAGDDRNQENEQQPYYERSGKSSPYDNSDQRSDGARSINRLALSSPYDVNDDGENKERPYYDRSGRSSPYDKSGQRSDSARSINRQKLALSSPYDDDGGFSAPRRHTPTGPKPSETFI